MPGPVTNARNIIGFLSVAALLATASGAFAGEPTWSAVVQPAAEDSPARHPTTSTRRAPPNTEAGRLAGSSANGNCAPTVATPATPFAFTIDGKAIDGSAARTSADSQRCTDLALARADVQIRYDGLDSEPRLNVVAAPDATLRGDVVHFKTYSNYALLIKRGEIRVFEKGATTRQTPFAVIPVDKGGADWRVPKIDGDTLKYVLRVYDATGKFDETAPKILDVAALRGGKIRADELLSVYGGNALEVRNISVTGGAVLVSGRHVPPGHTVTVMGIPVPVDAKGDFAVRQVVSPGEHQIQVAIVDPKGMASVFSRSALIPDHDFFYVALADLTAGKGATSTSMSLINPDRAREYSDKVLVDGRLAFYLKGKVQGDTLLTASMDTREQPIQHMFSNFDSKDPTFLLRNLDPNKYYPVYGDDSTTTDDAPTRGKFYVRLERGDSNIVWGNFKTSITGTEFVRYERGLYGARAQTKTAEQTSFGERRGQAEVFAAEPGTLGARDAFRGTGGSLYFTSRQNLSQGSERITLEQRDRDTGLVLKTQTLAATQDYTIDYVQGRISLNNPVSSIGSDGLLIQAGSLSGVEQYVVVNYEYAPTLQATTDKAVGGRGSFWVNDHVQVGVTGYKQTTPGEQLAIGGADMTVRLSAGSYVKVEAARSNGPGSGEQVSLDGGFTFTSLTTTGQAAWARRIEAAADLSEIIKGADGRVSGYYKQKDYGFSGPGELTLGQQGGREMGIQSVARLDAHWSEKTKLDGKKDQFRDYTAAEQNVSYSFNDYWKATVGARLDNNQVAQQSASSILNQQGSRTDVALRLDYDSHKDWGTYGYVQGTAERSGERQANNRVGIGGNMRINETTKGSAEISEGNGGFGAKVGIEHKVDEKRTSYLNYAFDPDRTDIISRGGAGAFTSGTRERFSDSFSVFGEERLKYGGGFSGLIHAFGLDFIPVEHWKTGLAFETGRLSDPYQGDVKRTSISPNWGYTDKGFIYNTKLEYRHDDLTTAPSIIAGTVGKETVRDTYLMNNSVSNKMNDDWRFIAKLNGSYSTSSLNDFYHGNFLEGVTGFAYRPINNDRLNALFKYTYFYNVPSPGQTQIVAGINDYSQQSHVMSVDAAYDVNTYVTLGTKYAIKFGSIKDNTLADGQWSTSNTQLLIGRADLHIMKEWDLTAELRALDTITTKQIQAGALVGVYRHMGENFKFGVGYNFTRFSDDLTNIGGHSQGVFVNAIGKF